MNDRPIHPPTPPTNDPPNNTKEGTMPNNPITEENPFPVKEKEEPMRFTIEMVSGELQEYDLWFAGRIPSEMSSMELVKAIFDAKKIKQFFDYYEWDLLKVKLEETGEYKWGKDLAKLVVINDNYLDCKLAIKEFLDSVEHIRQENVGQDDFHPGFAWSYRHWVSTKDVKASKRSRWVEYDDDEKDSVFIEEMLVSELPFKMSNVTIEEDENGNIVHNVPNDKYGYVISFRSCTYNEKGQHYRKVWPGVVYLNKTPNGWRVMWKNKKTGKAMFGRTYTSMATAGLVPNYSDLQIRLGELVAHMLKPKDILPILQWIKPRRDRQTMFTHPHGISQSDIYWIGGETSVKKILNKAYRHNHGVTKKIFGDINKIDSLPRLSAAIAFLRASRGFNPQVFERLSLNEVVDKLNGHEQELKLLETFFKLTGHREKYLLDMFVHTHPDDDQSAWAARYAFDTGRMFAQITSRRHRAAIKAHIKNHKMTITEIHDYVNVELQKIKTENRALAKTTFTKKFQPLNGKEISPGITMVVPTHTHDLVEWGATQNNCIGSYASRVDSGECMIVGFKDKAENWIGHAEIDYDLRMRQLLGKHNNPLEENQRNAIAKFLKDELKVKVDNYWGRA